MKKRLMLFLALAMTVSLAAPALGAESVTPAPPAWVPAEEYAVFEGSAAYEPGNWAIIERARTEVSWGAINLGSLFNRRDFERMSDYQKETGYDLGVLLEKALVETRLNTTYEGVNGPYWTTLSRHLDSPESKLLDGLTQQQRYVLLLWSARNDLRYRGVGERLYKWLPELFSYPQFSLDVLVNSAIFPPETQTALRAELQAGWNAFARIYLDGARLKMDVEPEIRNQRTMVPIRAVAEALGANVEWRAATQEIILTRAGSTVVMTLNKTTATVNGQAIEMDVAPYATGGNTFIPARYVAEFFGQIVNWDGTTRRVDITEDKSVAKGSNLEAWALPMGAMLVRINRGDPTSFGTKTRAPNGTVEIIPLDNPVPWKSARESLSGGWGITDRKGLISTVQNMTYAGHNVAFLTDAAIADSLTEKEMAELIAKSDETGKYMWPAVKEISERWGSKGVLAWDLFRMSNLVQWGYTAGYLTYAEALELVQPAATLLCKTFSSWDEAYENYLDGYRWWARIDVERYWAEQDKILGTGSREALLLEDGFEPWMDAPRGAFYYQMKHKPDTAHIFDDTLFQTGVIGLPE